MLVVIRLLLLSRVLIGEQLHRAILLDDIEYLIEEPSLKSHV